MPIYELDGQAPELPGDGRFYVTETAVLIGRVRLKAESSVWFGAVLRGDNEWIELGERSQIQDNATLHTDPGFPLTIGREMTLWPMTQSRPMVDMADRLGIVVLQGCEEPAQSRDGEEQQRRPDQPRASAVCGQRLLRLVDGVAVDPMGSLGRR